MSRAAAIVLGGIGLFGVVAHDVASRRAELALRIALGADPMRILMRTLGQGGWMVGAGLVLGGILSLWVTRALGSSRADGCWRYRSPAGGAARGAH